MTSCSAYNCTSRYTKKEAGITFHSFPKDEKRRDLWIKAVRRENWIPSKSSKLCSKHFREEDFDRTSLCYVRLREHAIPSIFEGFPPHLKKEYKPRKAPNPRNSLPDSILSDETSSGVSRPLLSSDAQQLPTETVSNDLSSVETASNRSLSPEPPSITIFNSISPTKIELKRKIESLSEIIEKKNKKIKVLQQKTRRSEKRVISLKSLIEDLKEKNLMSSDEIFVLESISKVNKEFLGRQLAKANNEPLPNCYSEQLRAFALTLHFYSPREYEYVRQTFNFVLPHQRTLSRWYSAIDGEPGFTKESFQALKAKIKATPHQLFFALVMDEMAIREQEEFDGETFLGHITIGAGEEDDSLPLAKEAFVLLLVAINDCWKLPLGY